MVIKGKWYHHVMLTAATVDERKSSEHMNSQQAVNSSIADELQLFMQLGMKALLQLFMQWLTAAAFHSSVIQGLPSKECHRHQRGH